MDLRVKVLGDLAGSASTFKALEKAAEASSEKIGESFTHVGKLIRNSLGVMGFAVGIERSIESASKLVEVQKVQTQLLTNQKMTQGQQITGSKEEMRWYSKKLDAMATELSLRTGIDKISIVKAQTLLSTNQDLVTLYKSQHNAFKLTIDTAANLSKVMGGGGGGSIASSARVMARMMKDPAKSMGAMARFGFSLSKAEQERIKSLEASGNLLAGQKEFLKDMNIHLKGIAEASLSPVERLKNDFNLLYQSLGLGLLPIIEELAKAMQAPMQALMPVLQFMGDVIAKVASTLGESLGKIFASVAPILQVITNSLVPALLNMITPLVQMVAAVAEPLAKAFQKIVGTSDQLGPLAKIFTEMGLATAKNLQPAIDAISKTMETMAKNGQLKDLMTSLVSSFTALAPIMPTLAGAFTQLLLAIIPAIPSMLKGMASLFHIFATSLKVAMPILQGIFAALKPFLGLLKLFAPVIGVMAAMWFTRKLFLTPIMAAKHGVTSLIGTMMDLKVATSETVAASKGLGTVGMGTGYRRGVFSGIMGARQTSRRMRSTKWLNMTEEERHHYANEGMWTRHAKHNEQRFARRSSGWLGRLTGLGGVPTPGPGAPLETHLDALKNSVDALNSTMRGGFGSSGSSGNPLQNEEKKLLGDAEKKLAGTAEKDALHAAEKRGLSGILGKLGGGRIAGLAGKIGELGGKFGGTRLGGLIAKGAGSGLGRMLGGAGLETLLAGGGLEAGAALIPGIGTAISAGLLAFQYRHQIGHALSSAWHWAFGKGGPKKPPTRFHTGGIVPGTRGTEVPAILQAGEAVLSLSQMRALSASHSMNVHPNAVNITIQGNADPAVAQMIKTHVEAQFKELQRTLKTMGR